MTNTPASTIRVATLSDATTLASFNQAMAAETEDRELNPETLLKGVTGLLENPARGYYFVAEQNHEIVGALMITTEWSDWRNGTFWWIQSVYVKPAFRKPGIYRSLYQFVKNRAEQDKDICGFRLYVEQENEIAQKTYRALGMQATPYLIFEEAMSK